MRTRHCPLWFPSTFSIELANTFEQTVRGRIQVHRQFRYLLTQFLDGKQGQYCTYVQLSWQWELDAISCWLPRPFRRTRGCQCGPSSCKRLVW